MKMCPRAFDTKSNAEVVLITKSIQILLQCQYQTIDDKVNKTFQGRVTSGPAFDEIGGVVLYTVLSTGLGLTLTHNTAA